MKKEETTQPLNAPMKSTLTLKGLDCAVCAGELEEQIKRIDGVSYANVSFVNQKLTVECADKKTLDRVKDAANHFEEVQVVDEDTLTSQPSAWQTHKRQIFQIIGATILFVAGLIVGAFDGKWWQTLSTVLFACAYFAVGVSVLVQTGKNLSKGKIFDENFLMTVASLGAFCLGEYHEGAAVMILYQTGELLQALAVGSSRRSLKTLMALKSEWANLLSPTGEQKAVPPESLRVGDKILVKTGEKIPVDCRLLSQSALLDTKSLTGESAFRKAEKGEELLSGFLNAGAPFEAQTLRPYQDSATAKILDLVENSTSKKSSSEKFITKFALVYTPVVCVLALLVGLGVPLVSLATSGVANWARWIRSALTFLVVSCPCALVISVPLTYFSGVGACAKGGILVKGATYLDVAAKISTVAMDKTGTLTHGDFSVIKAYPAEGWTEEGLLSIAASIEFSSSHPIAAAFKDISFSAAADEVQELVGRGLSGKLQGKIVLVGNENLLTENCVALPNCDSVYTLIHVAVDGEYAGSIEVGDKLRDEAVSSVSTLKKEGVSHVTMLSGDHAVRAEKVANAVGMDGFTANLLPDEKLTALQKLQQNGKVMYVGDGVNDAPVMTVADCAVSMGKLGSAAAVEASDFVLISDDLRGLVDLRRIARRTRRIVFQNVIFSIAMKTAFMVLGALGVLPLWLAVFADVGVMLLAVLNSLRVRAVKSFKK